MGNKSTEFAVITAFRTRGIAGWRRQYPITGKPDFCFPKDKIAVFVDGCFWHGCHKHCRMPDSNRKYWNRKIVLNVKRDKTVTKTLRKKGWDVIRIWEHTISNNAAMSRKMTKIKSMVQKPDFLPCNKLKKNHFL